MIDTDRSIDDLGPIVDRTAALVKIAKLLDDAVAELGAAGDTFAFNLSAGYAGFDTPPDFLKFNRAMRARVAIYQKDYDGALTALGQSFLDDSAQLMIHGSAYLTTLVSDTANALKNPNIYAHPALVTDAQKNGNVPDLRLTAKVGPAAKPGSAQGHSSTFSFLAYTSPTARVPIIRNEELILIRAEAAIGKGDFTAAGTDINLIRSRSRPLLAHRSTRTPRSTSCSTTGVAAAVRRRPSLDRPAPVRSPHGPDARRGRRRAQHSLSAP